MSLDFTTEEFLARLNENLEIINSVSGSEHVA